MLDSASPAPTTATPPLRVGRDLAGPAYPRALRLPVAAGLSVVLSALSLLPFRTPTFDVWAWLLWGREAAHLDLSTTWGPAFKPLPVAIATVLAPLGGAAAPLWLLIARVGGLLAVVGAARLAYRLAGAPAAGSAALALLTTRQFLGYLLPHGMSEPLTVAFLLWALDRHLAGRREHAFALGLLAGLLRPEVWPFLLGYALVLVHRPSSPPAGEPSGARSTLRRGLPLLAGLAALPVAWYLPDYLGSGEAFRKGEGVPVPGGPLTQPHPGLAVLRQVGGDLPLWVVVGVVVGLVLAVRAADRLLLGFAGLGAGWIAIVAVMAETGRSTGVSRYVLPTYALAAVLAGVGWVRLLRLLPELPCRSNSLADAGRVLVLVAVAGLVAGGLVQWTTRSANEVAELRYQRGLETGLPAALRAAGGGDRVRSCGRIWTSMYQVPYVAWTLHEHILEVWSLQAPGLSQPEYVGPLLQTRDRRDAALAPQPFPFLRYRDGGSATSSGATWTVLLPAGCR